MNEEVGLREWQPIPVAQMVGPFSKSMFPIEGDRNMRQRLTNASIRCSQLLVECYILAVAEVGP